MRFAVRRKKSTFQVFVTARTPAGKPNPIRVRGAKKSKVLLRGTGLGILMSDGGVDPLSLNTLGYGGQKIKQILLNTPDLSGAGTLRFSFSSP
jgi:hypothetical protein